MGVVAYKGMTPFVGHKNCLTRGSQYLIRGEIIGEDGVFDNQKS